MRQQTRHKRRAFPDGGKDPFNAPDADDIWWGFIEDEDLDWATGAPAGAAKRPRHARSTRAL